MLEAGVQAYRRAAAGGGREDKEGQRAREQQACRTALGTLVVKVGSAAAATGEEACGLGCRWRALLGYAATRRDQQRCGMFDGLESKRSGPHNNSSSTPGDGDGHALGIATSPAAATWGDWPELGAYSASHFASSRSVTSQTIVLQ